MSLEKYTLASFFILSFSLGACSQSSDILANGLSESQEDSLDGAIPVALPTSDKKTSSKDSSPLEEKIPDKYPSKLEDSKKGKWCKDSYDPSKALALAHSSPKEEKVPVDHKVLICHAPGGDLSKVRDLLIAYQGWSNGHSKHDGDKLGMCKAEADKEDCDDDKVSSYVPCDPEDSGD